MVNPTGLVALTAMMPLAELRGGIPLGIALGMDPLSAFILAVIFNTLVFFPVYFGMKLFYENVFSKLHVFNKYLSRIRKSGKPYVEKYGMIGLAAFVAVPLPMTGAYSGAFLAWLLNMEWKKSFLAVAIGVLVAGIIVLGASLGVIKLF